MNALVFHALALRAEPALPPEPPGTPVAFGALPGFASDDLAAALAVFRKTCAAIVDGAPALRQAQVPPLGLDTVCRAALALPKDIKQDAARHFFESHFTPRRLDQAFFTGYYEPVAEGALTPSAEFATPLLGRPASLVMAAPGESLPGLDPALGAGLAAPDGRLRPVPDRAAIEAGALGTTAVPLVYVRDPVEAFFIHIQGSARIRLRDGTMRRLVYAGRNGQPYTSIGRVLAEEQGIPPAQLGMSPLKDWIRAHGQKPGDPGLQLMQRNLSFIFFAFDPGLGPEDGPVGGAGISITALRSIAIDRTIWPYGLPYFTDVTLPWRTDRPEPLRRLLAGQDTGSAILGPARADLFFGTGPEAALRAGPVRHTGTLFVLWPK